MSDREDRPLPEGAKGWAVLALTFVQRPGGVAIAILVAFFAMLTGYLPSPITTTEAEVHDLRKDFQRHVDEVQKAEEQRLEAVRKLAEILEKMNRQQAKVNRWMMMPNCASLPAGSLRIQCFQEWQQGER